MASGPESFPGLDPLGGERGDTCVKEVAGGSWKGEEEEDCCSVVPVAS